MGEAEGTVTTKMTTASVKCYCCGLMEECTVAYIGGVKEKYDGRWICGLCAEAVKEEREKEKEITTVEALKRHMMFCEKFRSSSPENSGHHLIVAMKRLFLRTLDSPARKDKSRLTCRPLGRSQSCFPTMSSGHHTQTKPDQ